MTLFQRKCVSRHCDSDPDFVEKEMIGREETMIILKSSFLLNRNFQWLHNIFFYVNANDRYHRFYKNNSVFNARHTALILQQYYTQLYLCMLFGFIICAIENIIFNFNILMRSIYLLKMIVNIK